ncbi:MAG: DUF4381 family protein [Gemmataceae bacterium]
MRFVRWSRMALAIGAFLFASSPHAQFTFEPRIYKDIEVQLTVKVANERAERRLGDVTYILTVKGPDTLEVEEPRLGDAAAAWKEERPPSTNEVHDKRATWSQVIRLKQIKKGIETLPDVSVRFRDEAGAKWEEAKWIDILKHMRELRDPQAAEERPSWLRRWGFVLILGATALLILLLWLRKGRRLRREAPLPPDQWALREIDRIEGTLMPPQGAAETYHTRMSYTVRRYLTERFGLHALQQTTAEFLEAVHQVPRVTAEQQTLLCELFERCDLAKFARASTPPEECKRTADLARELVRQTSKRL